MSLRHLLLQTLMVMWMLFVVYFTNVIFRIRIIANYLLSCNDDDDELIVLSPEEFKKLVKVRFWDSQIKVAGDK